MKSVFNGYRFILSATLLALYFASALMAHGSAGDSTKISIGGFIDLYYSKNFSNPSNRINKFRNFDITENEFNLSLAKLTIQKPASPLGFKLDFAYGTTTDVVQGSDPNKSLDLLQQAFLTVIVPVGKGITINAGKITTHLGAEVIESSSNFNYSRSFLFAYAIPYYHLGVCAIYPATDNLTIAGYIYNGWNIMRDNNTEKTFGASLSWTLVNNLTIIENWIGGAEETTSNNKRHVFDTIINYTASDYLSFIMNADYGFEKLVTDNMAIWKGVTIVGRYSINGSVALVFRGEIYSDPAGFTTGTIQDLKEVTLTYEYKLRTNLLVRFEYRRDWSSTPTFDEGNTANTKTDQNTFLISSVISF